MASRGPTPCVQGPPPGVQEELERQAAARNKLEQSITTGDISILRQAIVEGKELKLPSEELAKATDSLTDLEDKDTAREGLSSAAVGEDPDALREALKYAKAKGLPDADVEVRTAERILATILAKEIKRKYPGRHGTPLHDSASAGDVEAVLTLLKCAPDDMGRALAATNIDGEIPLHWAARRGHSEVVRVLLQHAPDKGAALAVKDGVGNTPLHAAAKEWCTEAVGVLLEQAPDKSTALAAQNQYGSTPLHIAARSGRTDAISRLLKHAPDRGRAALAVTDTEGDTALHVAVFNGHSAVVRQLVDSAPGKGAVLAAKNEDGDTPLRMADGCGSIDAAAMLRCLGAAR